jgi:hypothetical protein
MLADPDRFSVRGERDRPAPVEIQHGVWRSLAVHAVNVAGGAMPVKDGFSGSVDRAFAQHAQREPRTRRRRAEGQQAAEGFAEQHADDDKPVRQANRSFSPLVALRVLWRISRPKAD